MKKIIFLIVNTLFILSLFSCKNYSYTVVEDYEIYSIVEDYNTKSIIIKNMKELSLIKENSWYEKLDSNFNNQLNSYDANYFNDKMLILLFENSSHLGDEYSVRKIDYHQDTINISLKIKTKNIASDAITGYCIFVEANNDEEITNVVVHY